MAERLRGTIIGVFAWAGLLGVSLAGTAQAECIIGHLELPVTLQGRQAVVTTRINGQEARLEVDTGDFYSMITADAAKAFHIVSDAGMSIRVSGVGGDEVMTVGVAREFNLGHVQLKNVQFIIGGRRFAPGSVGLLGQNVLGVMDSEYDFAKGEMRLLKFQGCGRTSNYAYWSETGADYIPIQSYTAVTSPHIFGKVMINGHPVNAIFDTGAGATILRRETAERIGIDLTSPDVKPAGVGSGIGRNVNDRWSVPIDSFQIGAEQTQHTRLFVGKLGAINADMLVGMDFFLSHRVLVARSQDRLYFTYNGGAVFKVDDDPPLTKAVADPAIQDEKDPEVLSRKGDALMSRRDFAGAEAAFDRAVALEPNNAKLYVERAKARAALGRSDEAAADYDHAIALDPANVAALLGRGDHRLRKGELDKAEADFAAAAKAAPLEEGIELRIAAIYASHGRWARSLPYYDAWIAKHQKDDQLWTGYNGRCWARAMLGRELDQALEDCNTAMRRGPRNSQVLDSRGLVHLRRGELEAAIADYDAALRLQPKQAWSLYGRGLAKKKLGHDVDGEADIAAALALDPTLTRRAERIGLIPPAKKPDEKPKLDAAEPGPRA